MDPVALFLLALAGILLIGALGEIVFQRTSIPDVVWLLAAGFVLGPISGILPKDLLASAAPYFAAITLVVILFDGGAALKLEDLSRSAPRAGVLAVLGFALSAGAVAAASQGAALAGWLPAGWTRTHGLILGAVLGGSSSIIVMPAMALARVEPRLAGLVSLESALTDALCVVGTTALMEVMLAGPAAAGPGADLLRSFGMAILIGGVAGLAWLLLLRLLHAHEHGYPLTLAALLTLYVAIEKAGGSAALGILTVAVILGNAPLLSARLGLTPAELNTSVRGFHRQVSFFIKSFFFVFIGAMMGRPLSLAALGILLAAVLLAVRVPAVLAATLAARLTPREKLIAVAAAPRGMAAGVLATLPAAAGIPGTEVLPAIVFARVVATILAFTVGMPLILRRAAAGRLAAQPAPPSRPV
jgi:cell volume regulation protein A